MAVMKGAFLVMGTDCLYEFDVVPRGAGRVQILPTAVGSLVSVVFHWH